MQPRHPLAATEVYPLLMKLSKNAAIILRARDPQDPICPGMGHGYTGQYQKMAEDDDEAYCFFGYGMVLNSHIGRNHL